MARRVLDGFVLHERIGLGSTASVWSATDRDGRHVALKELHPHLAADADSVNRFEREARIAAALEHPHIVPVVDWGCTDGRWFIAFERVDGADLRRVLQEGPLPPQAVLAVAIDLLSALTFAHGRGVIHRDVKPANVLLTREGVAKLADFSIARNAEFPAMTMTGALVGTPAYMSPEQVWGREIDARSDLWSVGLILWEMLAGRRPHEGATSPEFLGSSGPPAAPAEAPLFFGREIVRALETGPAERHESALAFREALRAAAKLDGIEPDRSALAARVAAVSPAASRTRALASFEASRITRIRRPLVAIGAAAALAAISLPFLAVEKRNAARWTAGPDTAAAEAEVESHPAPAIVEPPAVEARRIVEPPLASPTRVDSKKHADATMLTVNAAPSGDVWLNGMYVGESPLWGFPVTPGRHRIAVRSAQCSPRELTVVAPAGRETEVELSLACAADPL